MSEPTKIEIYHDADGRECLRVWGADGFCEWNKGPAYVQALREFFLAERDAELGRWRDPEAPEWVAYQPPECADYDLVIVCETSGESCHYYRADDDGHKAGHPWENLFARTARRYFAAHPEPKPWDSPEPGDVWVLTVEGQTETWKWNSTGQFTRLRDGTPLYDYQRDHVTDARRIWPEVSGE